MADDFSWQDSLAAALSEAAAKEPADTPRAAQLATVTTANIPDVRTVIVRAIEGDVLLFHTDRRSAKARHIAETPWVALAWYIPETRMQYRLYGMATEAPERAQSLWADVRPADRANYLGPSPGKPVKGGRPPGPGEDSDIPESFMPVAVTVEQADVLVLGEPHRRWTCVRRNDGTWMAKEVVP